MNRKNILIMAIAGVSAAGVISMLYLYPRPEKTPSIGNRRLQDGVVLRDGAGSATESEVGEPEKNLERKTVAQAPTGQEGSGPQSGSDLELFSDISTDYPTPPMGEEVQLESRTSKNSAENVQPSRAEGTAGEEVSGTSAEGLVTSNGEATRALAVSEGVESGENPIKIKGSAIALAVENREPKGISARIPLSQGRVYCWVRVINGKGRAIIVRWMSKGRELWKTRLSIGSDDWRTWAYITLRPSMIGPARADILNEEGELLHTESFEITE